MTSCHHDNILMTHVNNIWTPAKPRSLFENRHFVSHRPLCCHEIPVIVRHFAYIFPLYSFTKWRAQRGKFLNIPLFFMIFLMKILCVEKIRSRPRENLCVDKIGSRPHSNLCVDKIGSRPREIFGFAHLLFEN